MPELAFGATKRRTTSPREGTMQVIFRQAAVVTKRTVHGQKLKVEFRHGEMLSFYELTKRFEIPEGWILDLWTSSTDDEHYEVPADLVQLDQQDFPT